MNLIEQLGGYDAAKKFTNDECVDGFDVQALRDELLEYRRKHNIFDVGDKVIYDEFKSVGTLERSIGSSNRLVSINYGLGGITVLIKFLRHATTEEIQAGRRL